MYREELSRSFENSQKAKGHGGGGKVTTQKSQGLKKDLPNCIHSAQGLEQKLPLGGDSTRPGFGFLSHKPSILKFIEWAGNQKVGLFKVAFFSMLTPRLHKFLPGNVGTHLKTPVIFLGRGNTFNRAFPSTQKRLGVGLFPKLGKLRRKSDISPSQCQGT